MVATCCDAVLPAAMTTHTAVVPLHVRDVPQAMVAMVVRHTACDVAARSALADVRPPPSLTHFWPALRI